MQKYQDVVLNQNGNPIAGAAITVTDLLGTPVPVYASNGVGLNMNPVSSNADGRFFFYAPDGRYNLVVRFGGNIMATVTDILLEDPQDGSDAVFNDVTVLGELSGNVTGNAGTVTNGVYTTGDQTIDGVKTFTGNLGIGTNSPGYRLDAFAVGPVGAVVDIARFYAAASSTAEARILFGTAANVVNAGIGAVTTTAIDSDLKFYTEGSGTLAERARIDSSGNLLVGGTDLNQISSGFMRPTGEQGTTPVRIANFGVAGTAHVSHPGQFRWYTSTGHGTSFSPGFKLHLRAADNINGESPDLLVVDGNGRLGIGTSSLNYKAVIYDSVTNTDVLTLANPQIQTNTGRHFVGMSFQDDRGLNGSGNVSAIRSYSNLFNSWGTDLTFWTTAVGGPGLVERARIDSAGNVLVTSSTGGLGYGTGAGGTVTQATSKSTAVTLNRPCGVISMNGAELAGNASVSFTLNNTLLSTSDTVVVNMGFGSGGNYSVEAIFVYGGGCTIRVTNLTGGSLSQTPQIQFAIIKGAIS